MIRSAHRAAQFYVHLWRSAKPEIRGILLMSLSTVGFAVMHVIIRYASAELPSLQIAFFRNVFGFLIFIPVLMANGIGFLRTDRLGLHAFRSVLNIAAMFLFFTALATVEVAHVTALAFSAPIFAGVLSVVFLGERFRIRRWMAILAGFAGMLIVVRPGMIPVTAGEIMVISSAFLWAVVMMIIKFMSRTESSLTIVAYMNIFLALFSIGPAIWVWVWPSMEMWLWMATVGITGTLAQLCLSQSLKETDPTLVMPFDFLKLIWATVLGFWVFGEIPDIFIWIGGAIIFTASFYLAYRENLIDKVRSISSPDQGGVIVVGDDPSPAPEPSKTATPPEPNPTQQPQSPTHSRL